MVATPATLFLLVQRGWRVSPRIVAYPLPEVLPSLGDQLHPVLQRVYAARHVTSANELSYGLDRLLPYQSLHNMSEAVLIIVGVILARQRILIIGDFDADGATSTAVAVRALRAMGAYHVDYLVPNRFEYGYGLTPEIVAVAVGKSPDLIITVDNGISSIEGVAEAKRRGYKVVVTDHHLQGERLPDADAIVNPNQAGDGFASKSLAGVGVIFYVLMAVRAALREQGWFINQKMNEPNLAQWLDLVALGTVADVVPLDYNNRILVAQGLARIRAGAGSAGVRALFDVAGCRACTAMSVDLAFRVGPRLNAAGRMEDMSIGIECLLTDDETKAHELAERLNHINQERRAVEQDMKEQAFAKIEDLLRETQANLPVGMCLFDESWHEGIIGILASRVKERVHRPVIAFAPSGDATIKGSARSIPGLHIRDALDAVATRYPELLQKFGGHAMAAGLTLAKADYEAFQQAFDTEVRRRLNEDDLQQVIHIDGKLHAGEFELMLAEQLREAGPWGQGFPEPQFVGEFDLVSRRIVGEHHLKMVLRIPDSDKLIDAIAFHTTDAEWGEAVAHVRAVYRLDVNEFQSRRSLQLLVSDLVPC